MNLLYFFVILLSLFSALIAPICIEKTENSLNRFFCFSFINSTSEIKNTVFYIHDKYSICYCSDNSNLDFCKCQIIVNCLSTAPFQINGKITLKYFSVKNNEDYTSTLPCLVHSYNYSSYSSISL